MRHSVNSFCLSKLGHGMAPFPTKNEQVLWEEKNVYMHILTLWKKSLEKGGSHFYLDFWFVNFICHHIAAIKREMRWRGAAKGGVEERKGHREGGRWTGLRGLWEDRRGSDDGRERGRDFSPENLENWEWENNGIGASPHYIRLTEIYVWQTKCVI